MFTGIIEAEGTIEKIAIQGGGWKVTIQTGTLNMSDVHIGDSIAANGICLTVIEFDDNFYVADVSAETIKVTTTADWAVGVRVNLEKSLRLQDRLGGHLVSGHVDGVGMIKSVSQNGSSWQYEVEAPIVICKYIATKGSICINGVSLTVNHIQGCVFGINVIPHTHQQTTIKKFIVGTKVNLEVDLLARYLERIVNTPQAVNGTKITPEFLQENGFR